MLGCRHLCRQASSVEQASASFSLCRARNTCRGSSMLCVESSCWQMEPDALLNSRATIGGAANSVYRSRTAQRLCNTNARPLLT